MMEVGMDDAKKIAEEYIDALSVDPRDFFSKEERIVAYVKMEAEHQANRGKDLEKLETVLASKWRLDRHR